MESIRDDTSDEPAEVLPTRSIDDVYNRLDGIEARLGNIESKLEALALKTKSIHDPEAINRFRPQNVRRASMLGIPLEIRLKIYRKLFLAPSPIRYPRNHVGQYPGITYPIMYLCKQIRHEASLVLYGENTFQLSVNIGAAFVSKKELITSLRLEVNCATFNPFRIADLPAWEPMRHEALDRQGSRIADMWLEGRCKSMMLFYRFPKLKVLELDVSNWELKNEDEFPAKLLNALKAAGTRLNKIVLIGLEEQLAAKKEIEDSVVGDMKD